MPANYVLIEKISVGAAGAASVTFSGIPQTGYTDLVILSSTRDGTNADNNSEFRVKFNGSATSYSNKYLQGNGSSASSGTYGTTFLYTGETDSNTATASTFGSSTIYIPNYTSANYKSVSSDLTSEENTSVSYATLTAGLWSNTAAITSIEFTCNGSFAQYSTFYLYGVAKLGTTPAIVPYATGGDTIMTDGTYWYHTFISSGTFTPQKSLTCDYMVVAGGGSGGSYAGAGGGAGGLRSTVTATGGGGSLESALSLASGTGYTVTVGAGGAAVNNTGIGRAGLQGSNSVFSTITATGGGGGGSYSEIAPTTGGSGGGGGGYNSATPSIGAAGTANQGYAGGNGSGAPGAGAGGGGANAVGSAASGTIGGAGGAGVTTSISGSSVTYAGGGGGAGVTGGAGGSGGGGASANGTNTPGTSGTANTGGGGGGVRDQADARAHTSGAGGSGIVIVRYAV